MKNGEYKDFSYTGGMQNFTIPNDGLYQLEVWGCHSGGSGGYSKGYKYLTKGTVLYVCCGGNPYNGGGSGRWGGLSGGGGTHIATVSGTISGIGKTNFDKYGLIVAGGGGGGWGGYDSGYGGSGGGLNGGSWGATGGSQTSGGIGNPSGAHEGGANGGFGQGANGGRTGQYLEQDWAAGGGGGGYFGGGAYYTNAHGGGAGGSGWIGGVPTVTYKNVTYTPSTSNGVNKTTGKAKITLIKKKGAAKVGDVDGTIYIGDEELYSLNVGDTEL